MRQSKWFVQGLGIGLGLAMGAAFFLPSPAAQAMPTVEKLEKKLTKRLVKLLKNAQNKGTVEGGVVRGIVTDTADPEELGRVKVRFPWMSAGETSSWWARPVADASGLYALPEKEDEVLVVFAHGDVRTPYVVGLVSRPGPTRR